MHIVIIEDHEATARAMRDALEDFGAVSVITKSDRGRNPMPRQEDVELVIKQSDVVLLDFDLDARYQGSDLLPATVGKRVLGISRTVKLGDVQWSDKEFLLENEHKARAVQSLRRAVSALHTLR